MVRNKSFEDGVGRFDVACFPDSLQFIQEGSRITAYDPAAMDRVRDVIPSGPTITSSPGFTSRS